MNLEQLQSRLDKDWVRRKKEFVAHDQLLDSVTDTAQQNFLLRFGVVLLYSHWGGFIKVGVHNLLNFYKRLPQEKVPRQALAALVMGYLKNIEHFPHIPQRNLDLINFLQDSQKYADSVHALNPQNCFRTESNINHDVFANILFVCCSELDISLKENFINEFVGFRNKIAHGEKIPVSMHDYQKFKDEIVAMLEQYKDSILDAAQQCLIEEQVNG